MSNEEARRIVTAGLERRKAEREQAAQEARLEKYEQEQILFCNMHCTDAKVQRQKEETGRLNRERFAAMRAAQAEAIAKQMARDQAATDAVRKYIMVCLVMFTLTIFTHLPLWAAFTTIMGMAVFPAAYIFRLYYPLED